MIYENYIAKIREVPKAERFLVNRNRGHNELSPSESLLRDYKSGKLTWDQLWSQYISELTDKSWDTLLALAKRSESENVCLICYEKDFPCHRFILLGLLMDLGARVMA